MGKLLQEFPSNSLEKIYCGWVQTGTEAPFDVTETSREKCPPFIFPQMFVGETGTAVPPEKNLDFL